MDELLAVNTSPMDQTVLKALSTDYKGTPFGSLVPYAVDAEERPYIFVSDITNKEREELHKPRPSAISATSISSD